MFVSVVPSVVTVQAVVEVVSGHSTVLSEEDIRLRCSVTDTRNSTWKIWWFKGSERLSREGDTLVLWRTHVKDSGQFYCQGVRDSVVGHIFTLKSLPVEINVQGMMQFLRSRRKSPLVHTCQAPNDLFWRLVIFEALYGYFCVFQSRKQVQCAFFNLRTETGLFHVMIEIMPQELIYVFTFWLFSGGWAILQGPLLPGLVGEAMNLTCHVRGNPRLIEWFLYKDGVEVTRQKGYKSHFHLSNLSLKDQGSYSCRASWDANRRTHSVISAVTQVQVLGEFIHWLHFLRFGK